MSDLHGPGPIINGVNWHPYYCPVCEGGDQDIVPCLCSGYGVITAEQANGFPPEELIPVPRPPGVRKEGPCGDCAVRVGSQEQDHDHDLTNSVLRRDRPFWCHVGQADVNDRHVYTLTAVVEGAGEIPIGAQLCAGWWQWLTTGQLPRRPYQDLGHVRRRGADRRRAQFAAARGTGEGSEDEPQQAAGAAEVSTSRDLDNVPQPARQDRRPGVRPDDREHTPGHDLILEPVQDRAEATDEDPDGEVGRESHR